MVLRDDAVDAFVARLSSVAHALETTGIPHRSKHVENEVFELLRRDVGDAIKQFAVLLVLGIIVLGALRPFLTRLMTASDIIGSGGDEAIIGDGESIVVREGETLDDIKARLKPKKSSISADLLDTANTYDDKIALIRMMVGDDSGRVTAVLKSLIQSES